MGAGGATLFVHAYLCFFSIATYLPHVWWPTGWLVATTGGYKGYYAQALLRGVVTTPIGISDTTNSRILYQ